MIQGLAWLQHQLTALLGAQLQLLSQDDFLQLAFTMIAKPIVAASADYPKSLAMSNFQDFTTIMEDAVRLAR